MRISELISKMGVSDDNAAAAQLERMFPESVFGIFVHGLPKGKHGEKVRVDGSGSVTMQPVMDANGRMMIKACADPDLFDINYPGCINATMTGRELLEMVQKLPESDGILVCSATSFESFPIYKDASRRVKRTQRVGSLRKWWQFWKRP